MRTKDEVIGAWKHISENDKQWWIGTSIDLMKVEGMQELGTESIKLFQSQPEVIRCKDCKHRPSREFEGAEGFALEFPDYRCPCQCDDGYYSWYPNDDWYCADGERKEQTDDSGKA